MSAPPQPIPERQQSGIMRRIIGLVVAIAIILITSMLIVYGYVINTIFDFNLQSNPLFSTLPAAAQNVFGTAVSYTLTTYSAIVAIVVILGIAITISAIFGLKSRVEDSEEF